MKFLLGISRAVDAVTTVIGQSVSWLLLAAVLISATNAVVRKIFDMSSNAWLEVQWYLYGAVFMLAAAYALLKNEHVRIDILSSTWSKRTRDVMDLVLHVIFLIPFAGLMTYLAWPWFWNSFSSGEMSSNAAWSGDLACQTRRIARLFPALASGIFGNHQALRRDRRIYCRSPRAGTVGL